ncbi:MAG: hypothetical protein IEMM0008_1383 [bacterium]|nr:MAG: hypothetical protein IEMM0008_1383 [bacterium]
MKIILNNLRALTIYENYLSLKAHIANHNLNLDRIKPSTPCQLIVDDRRIHCNIESKNERGNKKTILLHLDQSFDTVMKLYRYVVKEKNMELTLMTDEVVDEELYLEAAKLLEELAVKTNRSQRDLLLELTAFRKGVDGKDELRFVSQKQMVVIIAKMKELLGGKGFLAIEEKNEEKKYTEV